MLFAAIDQVPSDLHDNAIILGCLSFFVAFLFLIDLGDPMGRKRSGATQTDTNSIDRNDQSKKQIAVISNNANVVSSGSGANAVFAENLNQPDQTDHQANNLQKNAPSTAIKPKNLNVRLPPKTQTQTQYLETDFNEQEAAERFQRAPMQSRNYSQNYRQPKMEAPENHYMEEAAEDEFEYHNGTPQNYRNHNQNLMQESQQMNHNMREDYVQRQIFPTAQTPVFAKVKPAPTIINHFESEPYKKILSRPTQFQQRPNQQYYPQRHVHPQHNHQNPRQQLYHDNANYVDDFAVYRHQTYVQASKVDQGKLVIRDYSKKAQPQKKCDCNHPNCAGPNHFEEEPANPIKIRPGYVANVAKIFDSRMMRVSKPEQQDIKGLSTVV